MSDFTRGMLPPGRINPRSMAAERVELPYDDPYDVDEVTQTALAQADAAARGLLHAARHVEDLPAPEEPGARAAHVAREVVLGQRARRVRDDLDGPLPSGQDAVAAELARLEGEAAVAREGIEREAQKAQRWRDENIRRKHNYIPFIFNFLKVLAEKKKLEPLIAKARGQ